VKASREDIHASLVQDAEHAEYQIVATAAGLG